MASTNAVEELDAVRVRTGPGNESRQRVHPLDDAADARSPRRCATPTRRPGGCGRSSTPTRLNAVGQPVGYALIPQGQPLLLADEGAAVRRRGAFATHHLWVTQYDPDERYPAGDLVNGNPGGAGLPAFVGPEPGIDGEDIVLWHTFGSTHFPRPEDWPVMPVDSAGFTLKPVGFFDRNPTLDVPASTSVPLPPRRRARVATTTDSPELARCTHRTA